MRTSILKELTLTYSKAFVTFVVRKVIIYRNLVLQISFTGHLIIFD